MAGGAADLVKDQLTARSGFFPDFRQLLFSARRWQGCLPGNKGRDLSIAEFVREPVRIEIIGPGPAGTESLIGLNAVMIIHRVDGKLAERCKDTLLTEGAKSQIVVNSVQFRHIESFRPDVR
jgi:hypothetical protein